MQVVNGARFELVKCFQSFRAVWEKVQALIPGNDEFADADQVIDPMSGHAEDGSNLRDGQEARNMAGMGLAFGDEDAVFEADGADTTWQDGPGISGR
jgi:hypothetical protein